MSRLTAVRVGAESISAMLEKTLVHGTLMIIPHRLRYAPAPTNCLGPPHTNVTDTETRQAVLRSSTVRYRPSSHDLVADLPEFTAHLPTSEDSLSADKKSASVRRPLLELEFILSSVG